MHITDWFSASWVDLLGQKSKSIVTDGLIGHFDPSDTDSFDPSVAIGKDESYAGTFNNLVAGGEDLTLYNGLALSHEAEGEDTPASFATDGSDDYMGPSMGYESDGFVVDTERDFTVSMWVVPYAASRYNANYLWLFSLGSVDKQGIALGTHKERFSVGYGDHQGGGMYAEEVVRASKIIHDHDKDSGHNYFGFYDWQYLALTKQTGIYDESATDKLTLYINGREDRLGVSASGYSTGGDAVENNRFQGEEALYVGGAQMWIAGYPVMSANMFGIILVYNRALKPSELRQNFLATNLNKKYRGMKGGRDKGYFYY